MDKVELVGKIFEMCIIPLLAILSAYLVQIIRVKMNQIIAQQEDSTAKKYLNMLTDTITNCVIAVNQTYVDALKQKGEFTPEAQKEAFDLVYRQVISNLTKEAKYYLVTVCADLDEYIKTMIEAQVRINKITVKSE